LVYTKKIKRSFSYGFFFGSFKKGKKEKRKKGIFITLIFNEKVFFQFYDATILHFLHLLYEKGKSCYENYKVAVSLENRISTLATELVKH
jgi:hypothetical protein